MKKSIFLFGMLVLSSCGWFEAEKPMELSINSEYYLDYDLNNISSYNINLMTKINGKPSLLSDCYDLYYNDKEIYVKTISAHNEVNYYLVKIDLKSKEIGDNRLKKIDIVKYNDYISRCNNCTRVNYDELIKKKNN